METKRIIPCLDVKDGKVVKGINFVGLKEVGDPVAFAQKYDAAGADELVFLDISATNEGRKTMVEVVTKVAKAIAIPFTVGGGIRSVEDMRNLLLAGADKISINSSAIQNPDLISQGAKAFGSQCIVVAVDARQREDKSGYNVFTHGGSVDTGIDVVTWSKQAVALGAGEILLTSMDADGTKNGYDLHLLDLVNQVVDVPVVASGGCGKKEDILEVFKSGVADAALAASIFHYDTYTIGEVKEYLDENGISVRI